jgi:hypothetical protein
MADNAGSSSNPVNDSLQQAHDAKFNLDQAVLKLLQELLQSKKGQADEAKSAIEKVQELLENFKNLARNAAQQTAATSKSELIDNIYSVFPGQTQNNSSLNQSTKENNEKDNQSLNNQDSADAYTNSKNQSTTEPDYYSTLNVSRDASAEEIRNAYKEKTWENREDNNSGQESQNDTNKAYNTLSQDKENYDQKNPDAGLGKDASSQATSSSAPTPKMGGGMAGAA